MGKDGARYRIGEHQYGHIFRDGKGPQAPHFNVEKLVDGKWSRVGEAHYTYRPVNPNLTTTIRYSDGTLRPMIRWRVGAGDRY